MFYVILHYSAQGGDPDIIGPFPTEAAALAEGEASERDGVFAGSWDVYPLTPA